MSIKLGEICNFQSGGTPSKNNSEFFDGTIPWVTTTALNGSKIDERNAATWITEKAIKESAAKIVPANSIMVGTRVGVGKVAVNTVEMSTSQDIISLIDINEERWDKDYLCKFLQSKSDYLNSQARGATIKGIKINVLAELAVPDISVKEQCRISEVLNTVTKLINARQQQLAKLDELVKARFVEMFGDFSNNSKNWKTILFNQCFDIASSKRILKSEWKSEGIPFLRVRDMVQLATMGKTDNEFFISEELYASLSDADGIPQRGDILVSATSTLGKCYVIGPGERYYFKDADVLRFRPKIDINSVFFMEQMKTDYIKEQIARTLGITTVAHFTIKAAKNISMRYPDIKIQNEFADFVRQVEKSKLFIQKSLEYIKILKRSLMQQYFG